MSHLIAKGEQLFAAIEGGDIGALRRLLTPRFRGELTSGLPNGLGRVYEGSEAMIAEAWGAVDEMYDIRPQVEKLYDGGNVLIARGLYVGNAKSTGKPVRAAFAHFWTYDGERFSSLVQVTDSAAWAHALS